MNLTLLDGGHFHGLTQDRLIDDIEVLIEGHKIREASDRPIRSGSATRIDLEGRTLMPALIEGHVHGISSEVNGATKAMTPSSLVNLGARRVRTPC